MGTRMGTVRGSWVELAGVAQQVGAPRAEVLIRE